MVQIADLCSYALRRYLENEESTLFDLVFERADRRGGVAVALTLMVAVPSRIAEPSPAPHIPRRQPHRWWSPRERP